MAEEGILLKKLFLKRFFFIRPRADERGKIVPKMSSNGGRGLYNVCSVKGNI